MKWPLDGPTVGAKNEVSMNNISVLNSTYSSFFLILMFIYLFLDRERGRERDRERLGGAERGRERESQAGSVQSLMQGSNSQTMRP